MSGGLHGPGKGLLSSLRRRHHIVSHIVKQSANFETRRVNPLDESCGEWTVGPSIAIKRSLAVLGGISDKGAGVRLDRQVRARSSGSRRIGASDS
jgi:hypothetical protein